MVTFLTLYLGLLVRLRPFELAVPETAARVEFLLDGELRGEITAPPWNSTSTSAKCRCPTS